MSVHGGGPTLRRPGPELAAAFGVGAALLVLALALVCEDAPGVADHAARPSIPAPAAVAATPASPPDVAARDALGAARAAAADRVGNLRAERFVAATGTASVTVDARDADTGQPIAEGMCRVEGPGAAATSFELTGGTAVIALPGRMPSNVIVTAPGYEVAALRQVRAQDCAGRQLVVRLLRSAR